MTDNNPILRKIWRTVEKVGNTTGRVAGDTGDRVFGETDEALTVFEIKERDPDFAMMGFMKEVKEVIIPEVLTAYLEADEKTLKVKPTTSIRKTFHVHATHHRLFQTENLPDTFAIPTGSLRGSSIPGDVCIGAGEKASGLFF